LPDDLVPADIRATIDVTPIEYRARSAAERIHVPVAAG